MTLGGDEMDREKVIKNFEHLLNAAKGNYQDFVDLTVDAGEEILALLKEQESTINELQNAYGYLQKEFFEAQDKLLKEQEETEWEHLWDAPDGTYKGRCKKCGFIHYFIESHDAQYTFCPSCGRSVKWNE